MSRGPNIRKPIPRGCVVLAGVLLVAGGLAGLIVVWNTIYKRTAAIHAWPAVPCTVLKAETEVRGTNIDGHLLMEVNTEIVWEYKGVRHTGGKLEADIGFRTEESVNSKEEFCHRLRSQPRQTCYVNPDKPDEAVLRLPEWWLTIVFAGLSLMVVAIGAVVLLASMLQPAAGGAPRSGPTPLGLTVAACFGLLCLGGAFAFWRFGIRDAPDWKAIGARMQAMQCTVVASSVERTGGGRNSSVSFRPNIYYRYDLAGRAWHSQWYNFNKSAPGSSDREDAEATVQRFKKGTVQTCWVDPEQPWVAVLEKSGAPFTWLWVPAVLAAILGAFFLVFSLLKLRKVLSAAKQQSAGPSVPPPLPPES